MGAARFYDGVACSGQAIPTIKKRELEFPPSSMEGPRVGRDEGKREF